MINLVRELGQGFRAHCPACGDVTRHHPISRAGESDRARCDRCGRVHRARRVGDDAPHGATPLPPAVQPPRHRRRVPDGVEQQWYGRVAEAGPAAVAYRADQVLEVGQQVDHPTFGLGVVRKLIAPATAEVHFQQGFKRLRCRL